MGGTRDIYGKSGSRGWKRSPYFFSVPSELETLFLVFFYFGEPEVGRQYEIPNGSSRKVRTVETLFKFFALVFVG